MNRFANYLVRPRLCAYVVYVEDAKRRRSVARFADGKPVVYLSATDAFRWVIYRIAHNIGAEVRTVMVPQ